MPTKNIKALVLLSGGLDSMLAVKVLQVQGIEVVGLCYKSNFYNCDRAREAAALLQIELKEVDISNEMLDLVKHPPSGYGKNLNPCIDCHAFMIRRAGEIARVEGFDFVATGEVLGQRPFSQNKESLKRVAILAGVGVLRPLSAKLLDETEVEKNGLVNRHRLLDISGRGRERQIELAEKYEITEYPSPAGGCLLTDPGFSERGIKLLDYWPDCDTNDIEILKHGRVYWFSLPRKKKVLLLIGRHQADNLQLEKLAQAGDIMVELKGTMGPTALIRTKKSDLKIEKEIQEFLIPLELKMGELKLSQEMTPEEVLKDIAILVGHYAVKARGKKIKIEFSRIK